MFYYTDPSRAIPYWGGYVYDIESQVEDMESFPKYSFSIEAITGARESAIGQYPENTQEPVVYKGDSYYKDNCEGYLVAAKALAAKQLAAEPVLAEYISSDAALIESGDITDASTFDGVSASLVYITIYVTDANGNQAEVQINASDMSLLSITNIYKGVNYSPESLG